MPAIRTEKLPDSAHCTHLTTPRKGLSEFSFNPVNHHHDGPTNTSAAQLIVPRTEGDVVDMALQSTVHFPTSKSERSGFMLKKEGKKITDHQWAVYDMARKIPCGKVTTYKGLCQLLGAGSPRSVGSALRRNPFAPFVPCHRIIASDLSLGGFFGEWGTEDKMEGACYRKARMLAQEGVYFTKAGKLEDKESMQWDCRVSDAEP